MKKSLFFSAALFAAALSGADIKGWGNYSPTRAVLPLWSESFEGSIDDLNVEYRDGAKGKVEYITSDVRTGKKALQIVKTTPDGYILITPKRLLKTKPKTELQCVAYVRSSNSDFEYTLGFLRMFGKKEDLSYFSKLNGRGGGGPKMQNITNTAPGVWERKISHQLADKKTGNIITPAIVIAGSPSTSIWDDWAIEDFEVAKQAWKENIQKSAAAKADYDKDMIPLEKFEKELAADIDHTAKMVCRNGKTRLLIDGKVTAPAMYKGKIPNAQRNQFSGKILENAGLNIQMVGLRFGNTPKTPGIWSKNGFDVASGIENLRKAMRISSKSSFILSVSLDPYPEFTEENPDEVWVHHTGKVVYGHHCHARFDVSNKKDAWPWISMHSLVWRDAVKKNLEILITELKRTGLSKRIVGVHISGLHDAQFATRHLDYGKPAVAAFRRYLKEKYGTLDALKKAWKDDSVKSFESIEAPAVQKNKEMFDPNTDMKDYDFFTFQKVAPFNMQEDLARFIRKLFGKDIIFIRYCMGAYGGMLNGAYDISAFMNSKEFDIIVAQPSYSRRTPAVVMGDRLPSASFGRHGKLLVNELDLRTYAAVAGNETELRVTGLSQAVDFPMWQTINRKCVGAMIAREMGYWYLDMAPGWFSPANIAKDIGNAARSYGKLLQRNSDWHPSAAVVIDEAGLMWRNIPGNYYNYDEQFNTGNQVHLLAVSGVPHEMLLMADVLNDPEVLNKYRTIAFAGMYNIDAARQKVLDGLKKDKRTLIFLSGSGRVRGSAATGFNIVESPAPQDHEIMAEPGVKMNMLSAIHVENIHKGLGKKLGKYYNPTRFHVKESSENKVYARYKKDRAAAVVMRDFDAYRSVYVADAGGLTPEFFNYLVKTSGGFVASKCGLQIEMNGNFMLIHCIVPGRYTINLPGYCKVTNMCNNKKVSSGTGKIELDAVAGTTYWFALEKKSKK